MYDQLAEEPSPAHPYRVLVPILPLEKVAAAADAQSVACFFRPTLVADEFLAEPPRRIAQMHSEARRQLKIKWIRLGVSCLGLHPQSRPPRLRIDLRN